MNVKELKEFLNMVVDDENIEVVVFKDGISIHPDIENVIYITDSELYDQPVIEIGCG